MDAGAAAELGHGKADGAVSVGLNVAARAFGADRLTSSGTCQHTADTSIRTRLPRRRQHTSLTSDLIDSEADGVDVLPLAAVAAAVFLHQRYQEAAGGLVVLGVVVFLQQADLVLRVDPEGVCEEQGIMAMESANDNHESDNDKVHL